MSRVMILQSLFPNVETEGLVFWVIVITVMTAVLMAIIKTIVSSIVNFLMVKKEDTQREVRKISMISFIFVTGFLLVIWNNSIASFLNREAGEISFAGFMIIILSLLVFGLTYRRTAERLSQKIRRKDVQVSD